MNLKTAVLFSTVISFFSLTQLSAQIKTNEGINAYSFDLYRLSTQKDKNLLLSPTSAYSTLLMAYEGAKNKTKTEFEQVLHLDRARKPKSSTVKGFLPVIDSAFIVSNSVWVDEKLEVNQGYKKVISKTYLSTIKQTDFGKAASTVAEINEWVSDKTRNRIEEIISENDINPNTKLVLVSAVYFKGEWQKKFNKKLTTAAPFFSDVDKQYEVDFMRSTEDISYSENDDFQFISKPYRNSELSFCVMLPKNLFGIEEMEEKLNNESFEKMLDSAKLTNVAVILPKIKLETSVELSEALQNLGLRTAFSINADFSGITKKSLSLGTVVHKTFIEIDEDQTEAVAATAATIRITGLPRYKIFKADHPFVFFIVDNKSKSILFMGRYVQPTDGEKLIGENLATALEVRKNEKFDTAITAVLYVLGDKIISEADFRDIDPNDIEEVRVYKDKKEIAKYSSEKFDGLVVITLK